jgi:hypothetical protein
MTRGRIARGQHRPGSRPAVGGRPRPARPGRQRSIRSTITILLVLPLISLIALWAYAAASTVGGAIAKRNADALNKDVGGPLQVLGEQLAAERADTFAWQSARSARPVTGAPLPPECARILELCLIPVAVAELASAVGLPLGVVRVLLDDLVQEGLIDVRSAAPRGRVTDRRLLRKVLNGLHAL